MTSDMLFMMNRFPAYMDKILNAYQNDTDFRGLCEDYYLSSLILNYFKKGSKNGRSTKSERDYKQLCDDLELEILRYLNQ
jgi:hypothetical protein